MALTPETFQNLERDIDDTGKAISTDNIITPRYGLPFKSLPMVSRLGQEGFAAAIQKIENIGGYVSAASLTELNTRTPAFNYQLARVQDTGLEYFWNPAATPVPQWEPTGRNYLNESKVYTDNLRGIVLTNITSTAFNLPGYIDANGNNAISENWFCTDFIKVLANSEYKIYSQILGNARHAWFDENKVFISAFGTDQSTPSEKSYIAPTNARYIRASCFSSAVQQKAYIRSDTYVIDHIKKIFEQHPSLISSKFSVYKNTNVWDALDSFNLKLDSAIKNQNALSSQIDLMTDKENAFFVNTSQFVRAVLTPTNFNIVDVTSRVSDSKMDVSDATAFIVTGSCVVYDSTANSFTSHNVLAISDKTITVSPTLPANPTQVQTMHNAAGGQHLTLFGYKGLGDYVLSQLQKYSYKKAENILFNFNPSKFVRQANSQGQITSDGVKTEIGVTLLNGAGTGGVVTGTNNLVRDCNLSNTLNIGTNAHTQYLSKAYILKDSTAGRGIKIDVPVGGLDGFVEIPLVARDEDYIASSDGLAHKTAGRVKLEVYADSLKIHEAIYDPGAVQNAIIEFSSATTLSVIVTCTDSIPTSIFLCGIFAYKKSAKTSKDHFFKDGDVIGVLGDSWTQHPVATAINEPAADYPLANMSQKYQLMYPSGKKSDGTQWMSRRIKEKLATQGINTTVLNVGYGGQTSRWGRYWIDAILTMNPKPTHCILCFYINDNNSINAPNNNIYDIDPDLMFANKPYYAGGVNGKIASYAEWETNMKLLCDKLTANGIKPIVIMPSQTASSTQAQAIRSGQLDRIAAGFTI